ncbi:Tyrosine-protein kinase, partial [Parasponia andersonii]
PRIPLADIVRFATWTKPPFAAHGFQNASDRERGSGSLGYSFFRFLGVRTERYNHWLSGDLSYNNFSEASIKIRDNKTDLNLFSCCASCQSTAVCTPEMMGIRQILKDNCRKGKPKYHSLHINCGGGEERITSNGIISYEKDNSTSRIYMSPQGNWARSSSGSFSSLSGDNDRSSIVRATCGISVTDAPLYNKARTAPLSLKYYGFCLHKGEYNVTLHFAEIKSVENVDFNSSKKREFNVDIQGKTVLSDFSIQDAAGGPNKAKAIENLTAYVDDGLLQIHLYWAGKGSLNYQLDVDDSNGPLISAISVVPAHKPGKKLPPHVIALIAVASIAEVPGNRIVAVKKLMSLTEDGCLVASNELYHLKTFTHPNVVRLFDMHIERNLYLFVYEHMENKSLSDALFDNDHNNILQWEARFNICKDIAEGLNCLHEEFKIVHMGIRATNILLDRNYNAKISDFGLAKMIYQGDEEADAHHIKLIEKEAQK